jgi:hypothetical protein
MPENVFSQKDTGAEGIPENVFSQKDTGGGGARKKTFPTETEKKTFFPGRRCPVVTQSPSHPGKTPFLIFVWSCCRGDESLRADCDSRYNYFLVDHGNTNARS